jgi:hypothetical protein
MKQNESYELVMDQVDRALAVWDHYSDAVIDEEDQYVSLADLLDFLASAGLKLMPLKDGEELLMSSAYAHVVNEALDGRFRPNC